MKKTFYSLCFVGVVIYSCTSRTSVSPSTETSVNQNSVANVQELYETRCGKCHDLPSPEDFTAEQWKPIIERMAPKAKLNEEETNWVMAYLNENAKK